MTLADAYRRLGTILSGLEAEGIAVSDVTPIQDESEDVFHVDLRIGVPMAADAPEPAIGTSVGQTEPTDTAVAPTSDGGVPAADVDHDLDAGADTGSVTDSGTGTDAGADADDVPGSDPGGEAEAETRDEAAYPCGAPDCGAGFDSEAALSVHRFAAHDDLDEPIHRHEAALRAAYEAYDSFASMTDALGADVTPQTVRRNMMNFDIHELNTGADGQDAETGAGTDGEETDDVAEASAVGGGDSQSTVSGESESPGDAADGRTVTDGAGCLAAGADTGAPQEEPQLETLPAELDVADLRDAVVEGGSLRAAARRLDRTRAATRDLLQEHDLLHLVHGRVATRPGHEERADAFEAWLAARREGDAPPA